jgi:hypothetical protein
MAAKRVDPLKAKEAKQKKIAAVGIVLLLGLVAVQGPKTLKMLKGPQPMASATSTTPTTTTPPLGTQTPTEDGTSTPAPTADLASVQDSDAAPEAAEGQLATFERFASKDPFVQQAQPEAGPARSSDVNDGSGSVDAEGAAGADANPDADSGAGGDEETSGGFSPGGSTPTPPQQPSEPTIAETNSIAVNGVAEDVAVEGSFPKDEPTFTLVSIAKDGKSAQIGIAGGAYAAGGETMKLSLGKKLTLQNTADGSRYELELLTIQGYPIPKKKG